jgi:hypothetical protein
MLSKKNREILRTLGSQYMEAVNSTVNTERINLWRSLNRGEMQRPMVMIDELPWHELNGNNEITCSVEDKFWREIELSVRKLLFRWRYAQADLVLEPFIVIPQSISGADDFGIQITEETLDKNDGNDVVSHQYKNQFQTEDDIEKIRDMKLSCNAAESDEWLETGKNIFDGIAPVVQSGGITLKFDLWDYFAKWMNVETLYFDLADRPEFMHKLAERLTNAALSGIEEANRRRIYNSIYPVCHSGFTYTDEYLPQPGQGMAHITQNGWALGRAQPFTAVSPAITEEFEVPYISRLTKYFGNFYYGCCERLDDRLEIIKKIPNVTKISCSPWSDAKAFAEKIGKKIIMSIKPDPAKLAGPQADMEGCEKELQTKRAYVRYNGVNAEIILKNLSTINGNAQRLTDWSKMAMQLVCN